MRDKPIDALNMVPFIDIMLVLLTIVLTTSSFIASGRIPVQLPRASVSPTDTTAVQTIDIDAAGGLHFRERALDLALLRQQLAGIDRSTPFLLRADRHLPLRRFVDVIDAMRQLGFVRVALQTQDAAA